MPLVSFYTLETSENLRFSDVLRGYRKRLMTWNELNKLINEPTRYYDPLRIILVSKKGKIYSEYPVLLETSLSDHNKVIPFFKSHEVLKID